MASNYSTKAKAGLVPYAYDKGSKSFHLGAWKNLSPSERRRNRRALGLD